MGNKKITALAVLLLFVFIVANASALTAKIGSARMTLRAETGEKVSRSILVINDNTESVNISLAASGELAENVDLEETHFVLAPGEQKKAYFSIHADEAGTTETRINVGFAALSGEGNNAGFASVITFIASGESVDVDNDDADVVDGEDTSSVVDDEDESADFPIVWIMLIIGIVLIVALIVLLVFASKRNKVSKKRVGRSRA